MKNLAKNAGLLFIALGALCVTSCSPKDDLIVKDGKAKASEFASASIQLQAEKTNSTTGKTVERGTLHAWIKDVNITVTSLDWNYAAFMTPFELVANTGNNTNNINYVIDNVALGNNHFDVVTTTSTTPELSFITAPGTTSAIMAASKAKNPYAIYGVSFNASVASSGQLTPNYAQTLTTDHGRAIAVFTLGSDLSTLGGTATVSVAGMPSVTVTPSANGLYYWSNNDSTNGDVITFTVQMLNANGGNFGTPITQTMSVVKSTSVNNVYTINKTGITVNHTMEQFVAEPWNNQDGTGTIGN